jgi:RNA polymerase sigma-70 factor (ECF subfamily)
MAIFVDDRELLAAHLAGDSNAFSEIVREHRPALHRHALRRLSCEASAEDAVQETLVRAYKALPNFSGEYRLGSWLHRILQDVCADEGNRRKRDFDKLGRVAALPLARMHSPSVEEELHLDFDDSDLHDALKNLSDPYREALSMRYVDDLDYSQVSEAAGVSEQNARARVSRAKSYIKQSMRGLAVLPVLLFGLLKRGEKAVAAATSTSASATALGSTVSSSVASQATPSLITGLPTIAEAATVASTVAPTIIPVVAKAAMGIGLAAAVLVPGTDSPVHSAFSDLRVFDEMTQVQVIEQPDLADGVPVVFVSETTPDGVSIGSPDGARQTAAVVSEPLKDTQTSVVKEVNTAQKDENDGQKLEPSIKIAPTVRMPGSLQAEDILFSSYGAGRFDLIGSATLNVNGQSFLQTIGEMSSLRVATESDIEGRYRVDMLLVDHADSENGLNIRFAGFATKDEEVFLISGLFKADAGEIALIEQGTFDGSLSFSGAGFLDLNLRQ